MHRLATSFILGYHGCDALVAEGLLNNLVFRRSGNIYDWLGPGVYFWEADPRRGLQFAGEAAARSPDRVRDPFVVGAVIDLGLCLDLTTSEGIEQLRDAYEQLADTFRVSGRTLPRNSADGLRRPLDCAVIALLHSIRREAGLPAIDTVKGLFVEGAPIYPTAGFHEKTHTQIAVCNLACIKGVFRVPQP